MTKVEAFFHALGIWYALAFCGFCLLVACDWLRERRARRAAINALIRGARVSPQWIAPEPKGRG